MLLPKWKGFIEPVYNPMIRKVLPLNLSQIPLSELQITDIWCIRSKHDKNHLFIVHLSPKMYSIEK